MGVRVVPLVGPRVIPRLILAVLREGVSLQAQRARLLGLVAVEMQRVCAALVVPSCLVWLVPWGGGVVGRFGPDLGATGSLARVVIEWPMGRWC